MTASGGDEEEDRKLNFLLVEKNAAILVG